MKNGMTLMCDSYAFLLFLCVFSLSTHPIYAQNADNTSPSMEEWRAAVAKKRAIAEVDRQKMIDQLSIEPPEPLPPAEEDPNRPQYLFQKEGSNNWYDEAGNTHVRSSWGNWSNYDESKAGGYTLPDPLTLKNGKLVNDPQTWWQQRRPEILHDFLTEIYGKIPENMPKVTFEVSEVDSTTLEGKAIMKKVVGYIDNARYPDATPSINITMYTPANATGPVPMMVKATTEFRFPFPPREGDDPGPTPMEQVLALGWGYATVNTGDIQEDSGAGLHEGIIGLVNEEKPRKPEDWGVLAAWSWGLSRVLDYFETDVSVDAKQVGIQGHLRWGKTALLAAALDQRWAIVFSSCSGAMGASLEKRNWGETIDNVAGTDEYHWMAGNFLKYGGHWEDMPVDAHQLIALIAPRPVFITGGTQDQWSDPHGEFLACVAASPVYRLLGKKGVGTTNMPAPDVALTSGELAFRNHDGGHTDLVDWPVFLKFAQRYLKVPSAKGK